MVLDTTSFYDSDPESYSDKTFHADVSHLREPFVSLLEPGSRILDLGCGSGRDSLAFHGLGFIVDPVDGSEGMCRIARSNTGLPVRRMLFSELDSVGGYDGVWACASLLHLPMDELADVLCRIRRALRPGGVFYASSKDGDFQGFRDGRWYTDLTADALSDLGSDHGFTPVRVWNSLEPGRDVRWSNAIFMKSSDARE